MSGMRENFVHKTDKVVAEYVDITTSRAPGGWWLAEAVFVQDIDQRIPRRVVATDADRKGAAYKALRQFGNRVWFRHVLMDEKHFS